MDIMLADFISSPMRDNIELSLFNQKTVDLGQHLGIRIA
jgi:hypothetical protein